MLSRGNSGKSIQSVQRAIDILNCFSPSEMTLSLGEISARLDLNKATVHGILNTLHNNDYVCQDSGGRYLLGRAVFSKAALAGSSRQSLYIDAAKLEMQELSNRFQANGTLFLVEDNVPRLIYSTEPTNCVFVIHRITDQSPLHTMASGKLVLAYAGEQVLKSYLSHVTLEAITLNTIISEELLKEHLKEICGAGYSYENEELFEGVSALAVPIFDEQEALFGTVSLTGMATNIARNRVRIVQELKRLAQRIQSQMKK